MKVSPDNKMLASGDSNRFIYTWPLEGGEPKKYLGHTSRIVQFSWSPDSKSFASSATDSHVFLWEAGVGKKAEIQSKCLNKPRPS